MLGSVVASIVQLFFCHRITILKQGLAWRGLTILIVLVSLAQLVGGVVGGVRAHLSKEFGGAGNHVEDFYLWLVGGASADLLIAATLGFILLNAAKDRRNQEWTRNVLERLVRIIMETNLLTGVLDKVCTREPTHDSLVGMALISVILFIVFPNDVYRKNLFELPLGYPEQPTHSQPHPS
ncbi:hypothetical protein C0995_005539 [Termitomyces sp. Mi166|nr:hypothetical protein C0995_005539 [Termitomyces sp. Mi166\